MIDGVDALMLECNHDADLLIQSNYPQSLKERVGGQYGHMNNQQAAELLSAIDHSRLQVLVAAHLSQENNSEHLVRTALGQVLRGGQERIKIAGQQRGVDWIELKNCSSTPDFYQKDKILMD
jgi:phosphoribosyl 1,2-cyclic phosphodiesterase